ncbi:hypothetical protein FAM21835_00366 [Lentilactobacillus parabuchneri]|uniref:hypothetical protein n=1 Tax=Lentilactobacillus parabuchneri TaxID=152331 RepID=UPI000A11D0EF|nr:hypothetical protein [Lentilactobacillus parabuchneri]ORN29100.1 hypothetical protein FAM21835_00366 [Lentilactobacillus parabuchneri]
MISEYLTIIGVAFIGLLVIGVSMLTADYDELEPVPAGPELYEGRSPQFDVEVEPGTYQYDPITSETNIPENAFSLYQLYTIDNISSFDELQLNEADQALTRQLKQSTSGWDQFPDDVRNLSHVWTIAGHGNVLLKLNEG